MNALPASQKIALGELATWSLQGLLAGIFFTAGIAQLIGVRAEVALFDHLALGQWPRVVTGMIEVGGAISLVRTRATSLAGILLGLMTIGATFASFTVVPLDPLPLIVVAFLSLFIAFLRRARSPSQSVAFFSTPIFCL